MYLYSSGPHPNHMWSSNEMWQGPLLAILKMLWMQGLDVTFLQKQTNYKTNKHTMDVSLKKSWLVYPMDVLTRIQSNPRNCSGEQISRKSMHAGSVLHSSSLLTFCMAETL